ncbi:MAG: hypothetical protein WA373_14960 [Burkholderiales bacterium]
MGVLLIGMLWSYVRAVMAFPAFVPWSNVEEWTYSYTSAHNYLTYGFLNSGLLQDTSGSPFAADHPYLYTHMPAGPDLLMALILKFTHDNYFSLRLILAGFFVLGIWYYYRFAKLILDRFDLPGAGFVVVFAGPYAWHNIIERSVYSLYPLLAFAPYIALDHFYRSGKRRYLFLLAALVFLSSIYIEYSLLTAVAVCWIGLYLTRLVKIERKHLFLVLGVIAFGIGLHLLQNFLFLGPETFFKDVIYSLGNRTVGFPSQEHLEAFYQSVGILHHGSKPVRPQVFINQVISNLYTPLWRPCLVIAGLSVFLSATIRAYRPGRILLSLGPDAVELLRAMFFLPLWAAATIVAPIVLFPAYSQDVSLNWSRANYYYLAVAQYALAAFGLKQIYMASPLYLKMRGKVAMIPLWGSRSAQGTREPRVGQLAKYVIWVGMVWLSLQLTWQVASSTGQDYRIVLKANLGSNPNLELEDLKQFSGELYATNVNTPVVGFFVNAPGFGVCDDETITPDGSVDTSNCQIAMMRRRDVYAQQAPRYFFLFDREKFTPGFAKTEMISGSGYARLEQRLTANFAQVHKNDLFRVFDLQRRAKD